MGIPQAEPEHKDLLDLITQATQRIEIYPQTDGTTQKALVIDPKSVWYKTLVVASPKLARFVLYLEDFYNLSKQCYNFMSMEKAKEFADQIEQIVQSYMYSMDSKSGESLRDNGSSQSTLIDKVARNKIERSYQVQGEKRRSFMDALMGKDQQSDMERD